MPTNIVDFIEANPGCSIPDIMRGCDLDAGATWSAIVDADRAGLVEKRREPSGWQFFARPRVGA